MNDNPNKAFGLYETDPSAPVPEGKNIDRDALLMRLEIRLERYRNGARESIIKLLLPLAIAFPLSGLLIYYTLLHIQGHRPLWLVFSGLGLFVIGIFIVILLVVFVALDNLKARLVENADYDFLEIFNCIQFTSRGESERKIPFCRYFNRELDKEPFCLICPVYKATVERK